MAMNGNKKKAGSPAATDLRTACQKQSDSSTIFVLFVRVALPKNAIGKALYAVVGFGEFEAFCGEKAKL